MISRDESFEFIWKRIIEINNRNKPQWLSWKIETFGIGLSKEVGEICDHISVIVGGGSNKKPMPTLKDFVVENIDVWVYSIMFMNWLSVDYELFLKCFREKLDIIEKRLKNNG